MTKHDMAQRVAAILGHPGDADTVARYEALPTSQLRDCVDKLPAIVARLKAEGQWGTR